VKSADEVVRRRIAPTTAPLTATGLRRDSRPHWSEISWRKPAAPPRYPGQMPTVLVMLAVRAGNPRPSNTGNEIRLPPPATPLKTPAANPATMIRTT
jgi:hypothetical protein